jgi:hypothetical protein
MVLYGVYILSILIALYRNWEKIPFYGLETLDTLGPKLYQRG